MERPPVLLGRAAERETLDRLLGSVRGGQSAALVLRGEAGIGKTALLDHCVGQASPFKVVRTAGVEAEMELSFAALHQLCEPILPALGSIPEPQRDALSVALGRSSGEPRDRFLIALAVLSLLSAAAEERPLLCVVDDAQWLDGASGQILGFVARRLLSESVALVFAVREPSGPPELDGLPELSLAGLGAEEARVLLATVVPGRLDDRVRDRIIAEARGNPLAVLELPRGKSAPQLVGGFGPPTADDVPGRIEQAYIERIRSMPESTQLLLLAAAAEPTGDATLLWGAAERLGIGAVDFAPAQEGGLLEVGSDVRFRHPLVRSAAYRAGSPTQRRDAHIALAEASDPELVPDRRAWHRAVAAEGPDEEVAAELERSADRAQQRGGLAAAAAVLERSAQLTPDPGLRARRALAAAEAKLLSGAPEAALGLLAQAEAGPLDAAQRARVALHRGQAAFGFGDAADAPPLLLGAARQLEPLDPVLARDTYLYALSAALFAGRLAGGIGTLEVAQAARDTPARSTRPQDLVLDGLAVTITDGHGAGAQLLKRAVGAFRAAELPSEDAIRWLWLATHAAQDLWDDESWEQLGDRLVALARETGWLAVLPSALNARVSLHLFAGELAAASTLIDGLAAATRAMGSGFAPYGALALAAFRGRHDEALKLARTVRSEADRRGDGMALTLADHAEAVLYLGLGRYREACEAAQRGAAHPDELAHSSWSLPHLVEAAVRSDQRAVAEEALHALVRTTSASGTDWALGVEARSRALVGDASVEALYLEAVERLGHTRLRWELARAHLLYGEWLRRAGRRVDAREQLHAAHRMFSDMGAEAFAQRCRRELTATGEKVHRRRPETRDELTPQEEQIAHLARDGLTNAEIGAELFLSPRTVEWHLRKVLGKLGISSRRGLRDALPDRAGDLASA